MNNFVCKDEIVKRSRQMYFNFWQTKAVPIIHAEFQELAERIVSLNSKHDILEKPSTDLSMFHLVNEER